MPGTQSNRPLNHMSKHSSFPRRSSEPDPLRAANTERTFMAPYVPKNQPTLTMYTPFFGRPSFSQVSPSAQYPTAAFKHMVPQPPSHTPDDSVMSFTESASPGVLSESTDDILPQQCTSSVAPQQQSPPTQYRTRNRKRATQPKDSRATQRHERQRQKDDENLMALSKLFVPDSVETILKKDLLGYKYVQILCLFWMTTKCYQLLPKHGNAPGRAARSAVQTFWQLYRSRLRARDLCVKHSSSNARLKIFSMFSTVRDISSSTETEGKNLVVTKEYFRIRIQESQLLSSPLHFCILPIIQARLIIELQQLPSGVGFCGSGIIRHLCDEYGRMLRRMRSFGP